LFEAISKCKSRHRIKVALVGALSPGSWTKSRNRRDITGRRLSVILREGTPVSVNRLLNKSKVYLLLSKKEGFNKAIIEAMHANIPGFMLEGFNFGYQYPYINSMTGELFIQIV